MTINYITENIMEHTENYNFHTKVHPAENKASVLGRG